jgi:lipopolysaccharide biosynthesis regulator YciM
MEMRLMNMATNLKWDEYYECSECLYAQHSKFIKCPNCNKDVEK